MRLFTVKAAGPTTGIWQILMGTVFGRTPDWLRRTQVGQLGQIVIQLLRETMSALSISLPATTPQLLPPNSVLRQYAERGEKLYSYLDYTSGVDPEMNAVYTERLNTLMNFQGSIYDIIREFCPEPWFELWFDVDHTTGTKLVVYFREPPWSSAAWSTVRNPNGLVEDSIKTDEIVSEDIGEDWSNVNTIFWPQFHALPLGNTGLQTQLLPPLISTRLVKMFGLRAYKPDVTWTYPTIDEKETQARPLIARARDLRRKLGLWFGIADHFWSGTVTLKGRTDIRIGHKVRMYADNDNPERQQRAYVTEVTQRWSLTAPWTTTLALTRMTTDTIHKTDEAEVNAMEAEAASVLIDYKGYTD